MDPQTSIWAEQLRGCSFALAEALVESLPLGRPRPVVMADLSYLIQGIASAVEFGCTGIADRHFAWQKVRTVACGGSAAALEELPECLLAAAAGSLSPATWTAVSSVLANIAVYVRHAPATPPGELVPDSPAAAFLAAARGGDRLRAQGMAEQAADVGIFAEEVLEAVQRETGRLWQIGELTPPEEHLISSLVHETLLGLARRAPALPAAAPTVALLRCSGDDHSLGQAFFELYLQIEGLRSRPVVVPLLADQALARLKMLAPAAIAIACTTPTGLRGAATSIRLLQAESDFVNTPILLGGSMVAGLPQLVAQLGADGGGGRGRATAGWLAARLSPAAV